MSLFSLSSVLILGAKVYKKPEYGAFFSLHYHIFFYDIRNIAEVVAFVIDVHYKGAR
jgi:hypothetical protein